MHMSMKAWDESQAEAKPHMCMRAHGLSVPQTGADIYSQPLVCLPTHSPQLTSCPTTCPSTSNICIGWL